MTSMITTPPRTILNRHHIALACNRALEHSDLTMSQIVQQTGIPRTLLDRKLAGRGSSWTVDQLIDFCRVVDADPAEVVEDALGFRWDEEATGRPADSQVRCVTRPATLSATVWELEAWLGSLPTTEAIAPKGI